jgi:hypothetical protein
MLDLGRIDVEEIATALADQTDYEHRWLIDPRTGRVAFWTSDTGIDGENPVEIDVYEHHPELISVWHAFRDVRAQRRAVEWLFGQGLIDDRAADRFAADHPDPNLP